MCCSPNIIRVIKSRVKRPGCGDDHPPPYSAEVKEGAELYLHSPLGLYGQFWSEHLYHKIKEDEMGWVCGMYGLHTEFWKGNLKRPLGRTCRSSEDNIKNGSLKKQY